ncbi:MAG: site-2 protease family protein, partial [Anaerolineae bacterium]|nr:site-2 protease family protein [Anaerolineae bacterium]
ARFETVAQRFEQLGYTPILTEASDHFVLDAVPVVFQGKTGKVWVNVVLFVLTCISVLALGAMHENIDIITQPWLIWRGWPFAVTIMGILTAHEFSHYFVGRRYGSPTSLPYFIPIPLSILGTMGAVIFQRGPMRSRKALFDIGAAGPIGGLLVAIPLLFAGLLTSQVGNPRAFLDIPAGEPLALTQEGNSLLYLAAKYAVYGRVLPDRTTGEDVWLSPPSPGGSMAFAAWAGLLVTALNLFPIGQFDGGHIAYALWGKRAWLIARVFIFILFGWGIFLTLMGNPAGGTWLLWGGISVFMRPNHPPPLNDVTPLDPTRKALGWVIAGLFILILVPIPLIQIAL